MTRCIPPGCKRTRHPGLLLCSEDAYRLIERAFSTHPAPRGAAEPSGTASPVGGPASVRTGFEDWSPGELAEAFGR